MPASIRYDYDLARTSKHWHQGKAYRTLEEKVPCTGAAFLRPQLMHSRRGEVRWKEPELSVSWDPRECQGMPARDTEE